MKTWLQSKPAWVHVRAPRRVDPALKLHPGEAAAIALAEELLADRILIDEKEGREAAKKRGLHVIGTLAVLDEAAARELIKVREVLRTLRTTSFRMTDELEEELVIREERRRFRRKSRE